jgi:hypothetical protein
VSHAGLLSECSVGLNVRCDGQVGVWVGSAKTMNLRLLVIPHLATM